MQSRGLIDRRLLQNFDLPLLIAALGLALIGVVLIHSAAASASITLGARSPLELAGFARRQLLWVGVGLAALLAILIVDYRHLIDHAYLFWALVVAALVMVDVFGASVKGGERWIALGGVRFQPSEPAKIGLLLALAHYYRGRDHDVTPRDLLVPAILLALPAALILGQPDLGTTLSLLPPFVALAVAAGLSLRVLGLTGLMGLVAAVPAYFSLKPYQRERITAFLNPEKYADGVGYQIIQAKIAIGSGGLFGKGYLSGSQSRLNFLPERHTDFIFAVLAEEMGFVGVVAVLTLFGYFVYRGLDVAATAKDRGGYYLAVGIVTLLSFQFLVNVAMVAHLAPVTGLPAPFLSYGGSSLLTTMVGVGLLLNIRMRRFMF